MHVWYADESAFAGAVDQIKSLFTRLLQLGPPLGYFLEPSKSHFTTSSAHLASTRPQIQFYAPSKYRSPKVTTTLAATSVPQKGVMNTHDLKPWNGQQQ